jgi:hypothetical protein
MIFADSSFFIATSRENDKWHKDALKLAGKIKEHFEKTVLRPVKQAAIFPTVPEKTRVELAAIFGGNDMAVWGSRDGSQNRVFFSKMRPGDYILFAVNQQVKLVGQIALKTISPPYPKCCGRMVSVF